MLSPSAVANAKNRVKPYKLADERGMYLLVKPDGARWWRFDYRRPGTRKRNTLSLGVFPDVSLRQARERREEARRLIADGIDPGEKRKAESNAGAETFEAVAREWLAKHTPHWSRNHADNVVERLERDIFPWIGRKPISSLTAPDVLAVLRRVEARGIFETAHRERGYCGQIMRYAVATGRALSDITRDLRGALSPVKPKHFAAITEPVQIGELLRAISAFTGSFPTRCALQLSMLTFVRPGELRTAEWADFNLDASEWRYVTSKTNTQHIVPLATQAAAILRELRPLTGKGDYVFPGVRDHKRPMSDATINAALRRMGFDRDTMTAHGVRAMARTVLDEVLGFRPDHIEHQLAHMVRDPLGRAYNRTAHLPERRKMMQAWADYLDNLREHSNVVPIRKVARRAARA
jgi:integrase